MSERRGLLYAASAFTCWGLLSPGNEILLREMSPMWMQVLRSGIAGLIVLAFVRGPGLSRAVDLMRNPPMLLALLTGTFVSFALFAYSQTRVPATFTTLGFYTAPLWTALLARRMLGERIGWVFGPAVALLLIGGYYALTGGGALPQPDLLGVLLAIGAGATWGAYSVLLRKHAGDVDWRDLLLASMLIGTLGFTMVAAATEPIPRLADLSMTTVKWTVIQVLIPTLLALGLFQSAVRLAPAGQVNILVGLELGATVFFAWLLLDAKFTATQLGGLVLSLIAVSWYLWSRNRRRNLAIA